MPLTLNHQTPAQFIARFREAYKNADRERLAQMAKWLLARVAAGDVTDVEARSAFGMNTAQWNSAKVRMNNLVANFDAVQNARGE